MGSGCQSLIPSNATVWLPQRGAVHMPLGARLCGHHTWLSGSWAELLWIWLKAAAVLPSQNYPKIGVDHCHTDLLKPLLSSHLGPVWAESPVNRCRQNVKVCPFAVAKILLLILSSWTPTKIFLPGVIWASKTRLSLVQKQSLFFDQKMERYKLMF